MVGNKSNYKNEDIIRTFLCMEEKPISRVELVKKLSLGEGTVRSILDILKGKKLLDSSKQGHKLSAQGSKKKKELMRKFIGPKKLKLKEYKELKSCALLIKDGGNVKVNLDLRDEAIRAGAYSAILLKFEDDLKIPFLGLDYKKENPEDYEKIMKSFEFSTGNLLIISFAKENKVCENASLAVLEKIKQIVL